MTNFQPLLDRNAAFATTGAHAGLAPVPNHQVFAVTCMDPRVDPAHVLGVGLGDAIVFRNAGGRVTDAVIREIAFVGALTEMLFGDEAPTFEVAVIHHTGCGTAFLADDGFNAAFAERTGIDPDELRLEAVLDPQTSVRADVAALRASALLPGHAVVSGHVYDLDTGRVETVVTPGEDPSGRPTST